MSHTFTRLCWEDVEIWRESFLDHVSGSAEACYPRINIYHFMILKSDMNSISGEGVIFCRSCKELLALALNPKYKLLMKSTRKRKSCGPNRTTGKNLTYLSGLQGFLQNLWFYCLILALLLLDTGANGRAIERASSLKGNGIGRENEKLSNIEERHLHRSLCNRGFLYVISDATY